MKGHDIVFTPQQSRGKGTLLLLSLIDEVCTVVHIDAPRYSQATCLTYG
jgi:hypothetical protein